MENEIEKAVEDINVDQFKEDDLIDFVQKQQINSALAIAMLRKKLEK